MVLNKLKQISSQVKNSVRARSQQQGNYVVGLDIGTEFVKALIGKVDGDKIKITGVGRQRQGLGDMHSGAISDISSVVANCDKALTEAEAQAGVSARRAIIGIAGELVKGTTSTIRYKRPEPAKEITIEEMEHILNRVQKRAYEQAKAQVAWETGNQDVDVKLVNSALVSIHIDAYKVTNPIGFQGKDVAIQIYTAFAPMIHIGALERVANELDLDLIAVAAEPFAVTRAVIGSDSSSNLSAVTIDVGGGTTDIAVVNDGGVEGTKMYGIGGRAFTKTIAADMNTDFEKAEELKLKLGTQELDEPAEAKVKNAVDKTLSVWLDGVKLALGEFDQVDHLPNQLLLCGGGASLSQLVQALETSEWYKEAAFTRRPSVKLIEPSQVVGVVDLSGKVSDHTFITAMGLLRVGLDTLNPDEDSGNIIDKLNKLLKV
ncbi:MAG TPA: cell division FtsA domain-containing protein [Candidatus Saccharimonadales bacterium]|jgi:cell division protein FtsA